MDTAERKRIVRDCGYLRTVLQDRAMDAFTAGDAGDEQLRYIQTGLAALVSRVQNLYPKDGDSSGG